MSKVIEAVSKKIAPERSKVYSLILESKLVTSWELGYLDFLGLMGAVKRGH